MKRTAQFERTTRDIVNAFLELLEEKPFKKIVVQDIIETAMINRSTFYQHFPDKYAVLEYLQKKYVDELHSLISNVRQEKNVDLLQIDALLTQYFRKHRRILRKLLNIRTEQMDFSLELRKLLSYYFCSSMENLTPLERSMLSGMLAEFLIYYINNEATADDYSQQLLNCSMNVALASFDLERTSEMREKLSAFIAENRNSSSGK